MAVIGGGEGRVDHRGHHVQVCCDALRPPPAARRLCTGAPAARMLVRGEPRAATRRRRVVGEVVVVVVVLGVVRLRLQHQERAQLRELGREHKPVVEPQQLLLRELQIFVVIAVVDRRQVSKRRALEPGAGRRFTEGFLRKGGAVAPETLVRDLLGHDALLDVAGGIAPDNRAALRELEVKY